MFALFEDLGVPGLVVIAIAGVLFFGKRLPEVASQAGMQLAKLRRRWPQDIKTETGVDHEVRKLQRTFQDVIPHDMSVGEVARLASVKVHERVKRRATSCARSVRAAGGQGQPGPVEPAPPAIAPSNT